MLAYQANALGQPTTLGAYASAVTYHPDGSMAAATLGSHIAMTRTLNTRQLPSALRYVVGIAGCRGRWSIRSARAPVLVWMPKAGSVTDERNRTIAYQYDPMGRITRITPHRDSGDPAWDATVISFMPNTSSAYGIPASHWIERVSRGSYRQETYYDGLWRPLVVREYQSSGTTLDRFRVTRYDTLGWSSFSSYALAALTDFNAAGMQGVTTSYDALDRVTQTRADSEHGPLTSTVQYLSGFRQSHTNPRGFATTFDYQAFSSPDTGAPVRIEAPESQTTVITRDVWGKPQTISRTVGGQTITRGYVYDSEQRLCRRSEPETGIHLYEYDDTDNLEASAHGVNVGPGCAAIPAGERITRAY